MSRADLGATTVPTSAIMRTLVSSFHTHIDFFVNAPVTLSVAAHFLSGWFICHGNEKKTTRISPALEETRCSLRASNNAKIYRYVL